MTTAARSSATPPPARPPNRQPGAAADEISIADLLDQIWERLEQYHHLDAVSDLDPREQPFSQRYAHLQGLVDVVRDLHPTGHIRNTLVAISAHCLDWMLVLDPQDAE